MVGHRRHCGRRRPSLAGIPATLRHRTHLPPVQTDPRLDLPKDPHPRGSRPMDLAHPRRLHPTTPRTTAGGRPASPLGETNPAEQAHPRPSPPRLPAHPPQSQLPSPSTETLQPRPRTTPTQKEHPAHTPPRRAHTPQNATCETANKEVNDPTTTPHRLKIKLEQAPQDSRDVAGTVRRHSGQLSVISGQLRLVPHPCPIDRGLTENRGHQQSTGMAKAPDRFCSSGVLQCARWVWRLSPR